MPYNLNVPGWITENQLKVLENWATEIPANGVMVEVGAFLGRSSWCLAKSMPSSAKLIPIDPWDPNLYKMTPDLLKVMLGQNKTQPSTLNSYRQNMKGFDNIQPIQASSPDFAEVQAKLIPAKVDGVFLDAGRTKAELNANLKFWIERVKYRGLICGRGYFEPTVAKAVNEAATRSKLQSWNYDGMWRLMFA